eukprot:jgi/Ulvmu1/875/UM100_0028.1
MRSLAYASALHVLRSPTAHHRGFWSALTQTIRQVKGDDLKHEQFRQDLHYLYLLTSVKDHIKHGNTSLGHSTDDVAEQAIKAAASMTTEAMYAAVNTSVCSSLKSTARVLHDICRHPANRAAETTPSQTATSSEQFAASDAQPLLESEHVPAGASTGPAASSPLQQGPQLELVPNTGVPHGSPEPQLGRSHEDSSASDAARAEDIAESPPEAPYEPPRWLAGRARLTHREQRDKELLELKPLITPDGLTADELRRAVAASLGFRLEVSKSGIEHEAAGEGVWLRGSAELGEVVAVHPGVVYSQAYHTEMAGFPNITANNDCILARYDNTLVDARPWAAGQPRPAAAWVDVRQPLDAALNLVDGRHPLAVAQFVNHPPRGGKPNVLLAPFDLRLAEDEAELRRFLPYVTCTATVAATASGRVTGLALVARRRLEDEELFMDYRLNPNHPRPAWYTPVDALAEQRRWA